VGVGAFVETLPISGKAGATVKILGTNLTGVTSVTFNGKAATLTVSSSNLITAAVPTGATTGTVQVVTPGGTLSSNLPFRVIPLLTLSPDKCRLIIALTNGLGRGPKDIEAAGASSEARALIAAIPQLTRSEPVMPAQIVRKTLH
jgi:hypothetical protein